MADKKMLKKELNKNIGQHFLVDREVMDKVVGVIPEGRPIVEIGAGSGLLTERLTAKDQEVTAVELDTGFEKALRELEKTNPNLKVLIGNALEVLDKKRLQEISGDSEQSVWVVGNIPYHITEPLMMRLIELPIGGATFMTGARFANEIQADPDSEKFGKLTMLTNTFFEPEVVDYVDKESFEPQPRTTSAIVNLRTRDSEESFSDPTYYVLRQVFLSAKRGTLLKNILRRAVIEYDQHQKTGEIDVTAKPPMTKNEARKKISELGIDEETLLRSVEQLNNTEFRLLFKKLQKLDL